MRAEGVDVVDLGMASTDFMYFASGHLDSPGRHVHGVAQPGAVQRPQAVPVRGAADRARHRPGRHRGRAPRSCSAQPLAAADEGPGASRTCSTSGPTTCVSFVDVGSLRPLKVVADTANGMGGLVVPIVFERLPFTVEILFPELDGTFPNHPADPIQPENLVDLKAAVLEQGADIGLAFDGDADRVFLVDEKAEPVSGSLTTALVAASMLAKHPGETILYNLICSHVVPEVDRPSMGGKADPHPGGPLHHQAGDGRDGRRLRRRALGPLLLPRQLPGRLGHHHRAAGARAAQPERPAALRAARALPALRRLGRDQHRGGEPGGDRRGHRRRTSAPPAASVDRLDGLTVEHGDWWYNVRPSNTEPLLRLNVEARTAERCAAHVAEVQELIAANAGRRAPARTEEPTMSLDPLLLDVLACPVDKGPLLWFEDEDVLYNPRLHKSYAVVDGVPVLLVDEAVDVGDAEHERLMAKAETRRGAGHRARRRGERAGAPRHARDVGGRGRPARAGARGARGRPTARSAGAVPAGGAGASGAVAAFGLGTGGDGLRRGRRPRARPTWRCRSGSATASAVPAFVGADTLVLAVSSSGGTAETLTAAAEAVDRGARVVAVGGDADGALAAPGRRRRRCRGARARWLRRGPAAPRRAPRWGRPRCPCWSRWPGPGCVPDRPPSVTAAASALARRRDALLAPGGPAAELAAGSGAPSRSSTARPASAAVAARWWKARVNLNAKAPAFAAVAARADPRRAGRVGPGRRRDAPDHVARRCCATPARARGSAGLFAAVRAATDEVMADVFEVRARATTTWAASSTWRCSASSSRCTWPAAKASTRARCPPSTRAHADGGPRPRLAQLEPLDDHRHALAAADAHGLEAESSCRRPRAR